MKKFNIVFSIILIVLVVLHLCAAFVVGYADSESWIFGFFGGIFVVTSPYVYISLFLVYIILLLCSIFIKQLKGIFKFRYLGINVLAVCVGLTGTLIMIYRLGELLNHF